MVKPDDQQAQTMHDAESDPRVSLRQDIENEIKRLKRFSNRGLWALSLFLVVSTLAWRGFSFLPGPDRFASLGPPPSPQVISMVLVFYTFSAIVLSLSRMMSGVRHASSFCHVGYLAVFYFFYFVSNGLSDNYWAVFGAGFTILCVESYRIWTFCADNIRKKNRELAYLERNGRLPLDDAVTSE